MLQLPTGREASRGERAPRYERHRPERTLLYQLIKEYYPVFETQWAAEGRVLPDYVRQEFDEYLKCGRLEHGLLRVQCDTCHVAGFSLYAGVAAAAQQRDKLERLCRYIALYGCRVLRRLGTFVSAPDRPCLRRYSQGHCLH